MRVPTTSLRGTSMSLTSSSIFNILILMKDNVYSPGKSSAFVLSLKLKQ